MSTHASILKVKSKGAREGVDVTKAEKATPVEIYDLMPSHEIKEGNG
jgi:hypothetical protein